jgi:glycerophosphoryl diester phosphodiesterase
MARHPQIFAHRGARVAAPENTLLAFQTALEQRADGIELDVHLSKDGELVVIHDFDVDGTTDGTGPVNGYTAAELAELDASHKFTPHQANVGVPTLAQVLDLVDNRCHVNVEIKSHDHYGGDQVEPLLHLLRSRSLYDQVIVSSFNPVTLIKLRRHDADVPLGLLHMHDLPPFLLDTWTGDVIRPQAVHPFHVAVDAAYVEWAHSRGLAVNTWTVNEPAEAQRLAALGVDVIMTDVPDIIRATLEQ